MRQLHTFILLLLIVLAGSAQGHLFQIRGGREPAPTPTPARAPRRPRLGKGAAVIRRATPRFVYVTIVSVLPNGSKLPDCEVAVDDELEEKRTDEQGRLVIPMEPGIYNLRVTKPGYVTDGREIEVKVSSAYRQEEPFTLRRVLLSLKVKTNPPGVKVSLDGNRESESDANGLVTFTQVDPSVQHMLRGAKENFVGEPVTVLPYQKEATVTLTRDLLTLRVETTPPQADVYLDDDLKGTSDADGVLLIPKVKTGKEHLLRASREGYVTQSKTVLPNYERDVIILPRVQAEPAPAPGQTSHAAQSVQGEPGQRPAAYEGDGGSLPKADAPQAAGARQVEAAPPAPQNVETPTPAPQPQRSVEDAPSVSALEVELKFWDSIKDSKNHEEFAAYLRKYPQGQFADLATIRMNNLLVKKKAEAEPGSTPPAPEPATPTPTPTPAPIRMTATPVAAVPATPPATVPSQGRPVSADVQTASTGGTKDAPALGETIDWLRRNFASRFTYRYTVPGGAAFAREASIDFAPLRFEGCRLEWRVFDVVHRVSLSDLYPQGVKVELRTEPETTFSMDVWSLTLRGTDGREVFEKIERGSGIPKKYARLVLLYDDKEKASRLEATLKRAIELCRTKVQP
jgi:hypothetical protein